jgi:hypothetical protein
VENYGAPLDEVLRAKPTASKGRYLKKVTVSTRSPAGVLGERGQVDHGLVPALLDAGLIRATAGGGR